MGWFCAVSVAVDTSVVALLAKSCCFPTESRPFGKGHTVLVGHEARDISYDEVLRSVKKYQKASSFSTHKKQLISE